MEKITDTFDKEGAEGLPAFNLGVFLLRSVINDPVRVRQIDRDMEKERERVNSTEFAELFGQISNEQKEYMVGFRAINGCMKYLDNTLNIRRVQSKEMTDVNGLMLDHFLRTMERMQSIFSKRANESLPVFQKYVFYLRSLITDNDRVNHIDQVMAEERKRLHGIDEIQLQYLVGFKVIGGCMEYIDHTMKINKRQVKVLVCNLDKKMPSPTDLEETAEDELDNDSRAVFVSE